MFVVFPETFTEKHSPQTAHNLLQEEVARAEEQSEVILKFFASFIYPESLSVSFNAHTVSKDRSDF